MDPEFVPDMIIVENLDMLLAATFLEVFKPLVEESCK